MRLNDDWLVATELTNRILIGLPQTRHGTGPRWSLCSTDIERRRPRRMPRELLFRIDFARLRIGRQRLQVFIRDSFKDLFSVWKVLAGIQQSRPSIDSDSIQRLLQKILFFLDLLTVGWLIVIFAQR